MKKKYRSFKDARKFAHSLVAINTLKEWVGYARSGKLPNDIPRDPRNAYKNKGWKGMGDWLGTGRISFVELSKNMLTYEEAEKQAPILVTCRSKRFCTFTENKNAT